MTSPTRERLAAAGLRVKPLVWRSGVRGGRYDTIDGCYRVQGYGESEWSAFARRITDRGLLFVELDCSYGGPAAARAACQAHHEAQALALLEPIDDRQEADHAE